MAAEFLALKELIQRLLQVALKMYVFLNHAARQNSRKRSEPGSLLIFLQAAGVYFRNENTKTGEVLRDQASGVTGTVII